MRDAYKYIFCRRTLKYLCFIVLSLVALRVIYLWVRNNVSPEIVGIQIKEASSIISTPRVNDNLATIAIATSIQNESEKDRTVVVKVDLTDGYYVEKTIELPSNAERNVELTTDIYEPRLSSVDSLNPYEAKISVLLKKKVLSQETDTFYIYRMNKIDE